MGMHVGRCGSRRSHSWPHRSVSAVIMVLAVALFSAMSGSLCAAEQPLRVVTTIKPVHALVTAVMEGVGEPSVLLSGNESAHSFSLKPSEARLLSKADVIFGIFPTLEPFMTRLIASLPKSTRVVMLAEASGVEKLATRAGNGFEEHDDHQHEAKHEEKHDKSHNDQDLEGQAVDPHVWLDPENARAMTRAIVATLSSRAPAHAARFAENGRRIESSLEALREELGKQLAPLTKLRLIVFHDAYQYLERRFGLTVVGSITANPEVAPSAKRLRELRARIAHEGDVCVLSEPQFSPKLVSAVIEGSSARVGVIDPVGGAIAPGADHYHHAMRRIAQSLLAWVAKR